MKKLCVLFAAVLFAAAAFHDSPTHVSAKNDKFKRSSRPVPNRYLVVLDPNQDYRFDPEATIDDLNKQFPGSIGRIFSASIQGYSVQMSDAQAQALSADPRVKYVEEDSIIDAQSTQTGATWGISRIDQPNFVYPMDSNYNYTATGSGVNVYVIDSGVLTTHPDFGGRAVDAFDAYHDNTPMTDCNGHGTHVAGTIGSNTFGVAKNVVLFSVNVFPCWGTSTTTDVISGVDWVTRHAVRPAVANMSLGTTYSPTLEAAIQTSIDSGITYVVAAGNWGDDACSYSPSHLAAAISVGSTDQRDYRDSLSNYGPCVDLFAPGAVITSTWNQVGVPTNIMSGTSTASPHVAGMAALYLERHPAATPNEVQGAILANATAGILTNIGTNSPNLFAYSLFSDPIPTGCDGTMYGGTLPGTGSLDYQSSSNGFSSGSGKFIADLAVPEGASFALSLEKKGGNRWSTVASSATGSIAFKGKSGTYRWKVADVAGSGSYSLCTVTP